MTYSVLGISSGIGVSLYPFKSRVIGNIEGRAIFYTPKQEQWKLNFGDLPLAKSIDTFPVNGIRPDVVISSPDCGSGSILRMSRAKKYGDHKENKSLAEFFKGIEIYRPKFFLFENLDGLFKSFPEEDFDALLSNYTLIKHLAPVSVWGNSQIYRKRLIVVGIRNDLPLKLHKYFRLPDYRLKNKTCKEIYGDLDSVKGFEALAFGHVREDIDTEISIYSRKKMTLRAIQKFWQNELKDKKRWEVGDRKFTRAPGVYRNRKQDYPATARKANRQFDHNGLTLTPRQLARVQGVPDEFKLHLEENKLNYWINKTRAAVTKTPPMEISFWFRKKLEKSYNLWKD